ELEIPITLIDFRRMWAVRHSGSLPLIPDIERWLADNGIACQVLAPWKTNGYTARFSSHDYAAIFKMRWL
ncbi:hypothetical protein, partial [Rhizobium sp.]